jgi:uncharacterized protein
MVVLIEGARMSRSRIEISKSQLAAFCREHHIRQLSLFGSVLHKEFRPDSDVDVLVEFEPGGEPGFIALGEMEAELSAILGGRSIDLVTVGFLNHRIRDRVLADMEIEYAQG